MFSATLLSCLSGTRQEISMYKKSKFIARVIIGAEIDMVTFFSPEGRFLKLKFFRKFFLSSLSQKKYLHACAATFAARPKKFAILESQNMFYVSQNVG